MIKKWLSDNGVKFEERNLEDPDVMADLIMRDIFALSAPALEVDGKVYLDKDLFHGDSVNELLLNSVVLGKRG